MDDDRGTTMVLLHSEKGESLFNEAKPSIRFCKADVDKAIELDGIMATQCTIPNPQREQFFKDAHNMSFEQLINKYYPLSVKKQCIQCLKPVMHKLGILSHLKRFVSN